MTSWKKACERSSRCSGFSFDTYRSSYGYGCLKDCRGGEFGGYGRGRYDYWVKKISAGITLTPTLTLTLTLTLNPVFVRLHTDFPQISP